MFSAPRRHIVRKLVVMIAITAGAMLVPACVSSDSLAVGPRSYAPRPADWEVEVYLGVDAPIVIHKSIERARNIEHVPAHAELIGRVDSAGDEIASWASVVEDAKAHARAIGGDGLVLGRWGRARGGFDAFGGPRYGKGLSFSVIRYRP
jgi:hypothetical protein